MENHHLTPSTHFFHSNSTLNSNPLSDLNDPNNPAGVLIFDSSIIPHQTNLPTQFLWPHEDLAYGAQDELRDLPVDLLGFLNGDQAATQYTAAQIRAACLNHGFFQVINHGVDEGLVQLAHEHMDSIFRLPRGRKMAVKRQPGGLCGYSGAHADRFSSKLPWKETFSFGYQHADEPGRDVLDYIESSFGQDFQEAGFVFQKYCEAMKALTLAIFELLGISLGVDRLHFSKFFEDGYSLMRGNHYPPCKEAGLTFGTGPHSDPNSLTILHQDQVGGLQIFTDNKWLAVPPRPDAFVVNIGDTFMALSNGIYKSCLHRAVVNKKSVRRSLVFFVNPKENKTVSPPEDLVHRQEPRLYPNFTWSDLKEFTQNHYRADTDTLSNFVHWLSTHPQPDY